MKKVNNLLKKVNKTCLRIVGVIIGLFLIYLAVINLIFVCHPGGVNGEVEMTIQTQSIIAIIIAIAFSWLLYLFVKKSSMPANKVLFIVTVWCILASLFCIAFWHPIINADSADLWQYVINLNEQSPDYILMYPNNLGYLTIMIIAYKLFVNSTLGLELINIVFLVLSVISIYRITKLLFRNEAITKIATILCAAFVPLIMETMFIYNDMIGIGLILASVWQALEFRKTGSIKNAALFIIFSVAAIVIRQNCLIILIAVLIYFIFTSSKKNILKTIMTVLIFGLLTVLSTLGLKEVYHQKVGWDFSDTSKSSPAVAWIAMGLGADRDNWNGVERPDLLSGWWRGYNRSCVKIAKADCTTIAKEDILVQINFFISHPTDAINFFQNKILTQWTEPTFLMPYFTISDDTVSDTGEKVSKAGRVDLLGLKIDDTKKEGREQALECSFFISNIVHFIIVIFSVIGFLSLVRSKQLSWKTSLPAIAVFGYFLFSLIWEAKSRYILLAFPLLIPYAAYGILYCGQLCRSIRKGVIYGCQKKLEGKNTHK